MVAVPTRREHKWTGLTESIGRYALVRMSDDAGHVGWGEAPALKDWGGEYGRYFGESTATVELVIRRYLASGSHRRAGRQYRPAAPAHGCGDQGLSLCQSRARHRRLRPRLAAPAAFRCMISSAAPCAKQIAITHSIGLMPIDDGECEAAKVAAEAIRTIKIKVGVEAARDVEMVRRIRSAVGRRYRALRRCQRGLPDPGRGDQDHLQDGSLRPRTMPSSRCTASPAWRKWRARSIPR